MAVRKYDTKEGPRYEARAYMGIDPLTGKEIRHHKRGFKSPKEAQKWVERLRVRGAIKTPKKLRFKEVYSDWLDLYKYQVKPSTYIKTSRILNTHLLPLIGEHFISEITSHQLQSIANKWSEEFVKHKMMVGYLKMPFAYAYLHDIITSNPCDKILISKLQKKTPRKKSHYTSQELNLFLQACQKDSNPVAYPLFRLLAYTGLRRQELLALTWYDVDFHNHTLSINKALTVDYDNKVVLGDPKNEASERLIALDGETIETLRAWKITSGCAFSNKGNIFNMGINTPNMMLKRIAERIGLEHISPHKLRHTHCTLAIEAGLNIKDVQERLGHSDIETTLKIYTHANANRHRAAEGFATFMQTAKSTKYC